VVKVSVFRQRWPSAHVRGMDTMAVPGLFAMVVLALLALAVVSVLRLPILFPATYSVQDFRQQTISPACAETARLRAHGVKTGPSYRRVAAACTRAGGR
jgi:hypothetical protein